MSGTYPDSNDDITFWSNVKSIPQEDYYEDAEEMALLTPGHRTSLSSDDNSRAIVKFESPRRRSSYNFNEVASNLQNTAERTLEEESTSGAYTTQSSISRGVARIVLEERNNEALDSSKEYITGVVRKVARYAQNAGHDGECSGSVANQVSQPKGTTSLGTMVSFFVIWCVSLCASHFDSKDMPAPALKLAAEEVASVLQSSHSPRSGAAL